MYVIMAADGKPAVTKIDNYSLAVQWAQQLAKSSHEVRIYEKRTRCGRGPRLKLVTTIRGR